MAEVEKYRIPLLDGTNYSDWKFRLETLTELDLSTYTEADYTTLVVIVSSDDAATRTRKDEIAEHKKRDQKCKSQIIQRIADSHLEYAKDKASAYEIWLSLENAFQRKGIASQLLLRKALLTMKFDTANNNLGNHFLKFNKLIREPTGATLEESDVCHLLLTMPTEYNTVVTALETMSTELLTLNFVKTRLLDEESKRNEGMSKRNKHNNASSIVFSSTSKGTFKGVKNATKNKTKFQYNCHNCGLPDHKRIDCRKKPQKNKVNESSTAQIASDNQEEVYSFVTNERGESKSTSHWYLDSGATEHLASNNTPLVNIEKLSKPVTINVAKSGSYLQANQVGELNVTNTINGKRNQITIREVLLVKNLTYNLLSVCKLEINGFKVLFTGGKGLILKGNKVIAIATRNNSQLYELNFDQTEAIKAFATVTDLGIWHIRFGHLNYESIKTILSQDKEHKSNLSQNAEKCWTCVEGKQMKLPHNQHRIRVKRPLQLIHSDLIGPINPVSYDKKRYVLTFVDDYTHFTAAYIIESKTEVLKFFKKYEAMATAHFNLKVSRFRCDNGREYISNEIVKYFEEKEIQFEFTIRYTREQNGVAEWMNRTILERARCMILSCKLGRSFWSEVLTAVYRVNKSPTSALNDDVPARKCWFDEPIKISKLKVFGCIAYLHMPKEFITQKFESR